MQQALSKAKRKSKILPVLTAESTPSKKLALSQACFWTGERVIGELEGVLTTEAGWLHGREVTLVSYDSNRINSKKIIAHARKHHCANTTHAGNDLKSYRIAAASHQKHTLKRSPLAKIPGLTDFQKTKINAFIASDSQKALSYLTPRQRATLTR